MFGIILRSLCLATLLFLSLGKISAQITVTADESDAFYEAGETMNFEVSANYNASATYEIFYDQFTTPLASGSLNISSGQTSYIPFTLNEPGVVFCVVTQGGTKTKAVAAFSPYEIEQLEAEPADFDAFWDQKKAELAAVPMDPNLTYYAGNSYTTTYKIDLAQIDGRRVYGYISIPSGAGPFPAILELPAYGSGANTVSPGDFIAERGGAISMKISIHNGPLNQGDPNAYEPNEIDDADNIYIRYGVLAALRSIDYIFTRSDFDGESMGVVGVSQGGALSMMVAGIDERIKLLSYAHPAYCEHAGLPNDKASGFPFYVKSSQDTDGSTAHELATIAATRYYDAINFLKRYDGPSLGFIGYKDETSLASGIFAAYNGLTGPSVLLHEIEIGHNPMPGEYWNGRYDFFRRHFPAMANPPWPFSDETTGYGVDAGADASVSQGTALGLSGKAYDNENLNTSWPVVWEVLSGPGSVNFGNATSANTSATFSQEGTYVLRFSATDYGLLNSISKYYRIADQITVVVGSGNGNPSTLSLDCPNNINQVLPTGSSNTSINWTTPFPSGNCPNGGLNISQTSGPQNGTSLSVGTYTVVYQATDNCNNNTSCSFTITIESGTINPSNYCEAAGSAPWFEWISAVNFAGINNFSAKESYGDFTNLSADVNTGQSYPISITAAFSWQSDDVYVRSWIDYNNDNIFQVSEEVVFSAEALVAGSGGATSNVLNGTVTIPANAVIGSTRMRVALQRDAYANPCETFQYGEVEDYTININEGVTPSFLTIDCPQNIAVTAPQGNDEAIVTWSLPNTFSNCSTGNISLTQIQGLPSGSAFPEGTTSISYLASDACGNNETCSFIITVSVDNQPPSNSYCESQGNTPWNEWISNVSLEQINNTSSKTTYSDFTNEIATVAQGGAYTLNVTAAYSWQSNDNYLRVWIDFNQDNIFQESTELVLSEVFEEGNGGATSSLGTTVINIPSNAVAGTTRMRVALKRDAFAGPCESFAFGEVEDYGINISTASNATLSITCPNTIAVTIPVGQNDIPVFWNTPNTSTTCAGNNVNLSQTQGANAGSSFTEGTYQISYQATDNCGNQEICSFNIIVTEDNTPPAVLSIFCPSNISVVIPLGNNDVAVNWNAANGITTCANTAVAITQIQGPSSGANLSVGSYSVSYQATDNCNNTEVCNFTITVTAETSNEDYCESQGNTPWTEWLRRVQLQEIDNNSSKTQYSDFTNLIANVDQGETVSLAVTSGFSWQSEDAYLRVWIDYNQDGVFQEPSEIVLSDILYWGSGGATSVNSAADILIPSTAVSGQTRMRVALKRNAFADPCEAFSFGEVEDYTINVAETSVNYVLTLDCPQNINFNISQGSNTALVNWLAPVPSTTCQNSTIDLQQTEGPNQGSYLSEGSYNIVYKATDLCGNTEYCNFILTVVDNNNNEPVDYCNSSGNSPWEEYIWKVRFGSINNTSFKEGYGNFTNQSTIVNMGDQTQIRIQPKFSFETWDEYFRVWIDWNQDGDFYDSGEMVFSDILDGDFNGSAPPVIGLIETPLYALTGETRMRISMRREAYPGACSTFGFGEVEDYTVIVNDPGQGLEGQASEFLFMTAAKENGVSKLNWDCNTADRTSKFEVERSFDQNNFEKISETAVTLNATSASHFTAVDQQPQSGGNFYRIKQIFNDGSIRYSAVRKLEYPVLEKEILLFPNPAINEIYIQLSAFQGESVVLEINNALGIKMMDVDVDNCTLTPLRINLSDFENGMYIISVIQKSGKRKSQWFLVERLD